MWPRKGSDLTSNSEIQHPSSHWRQEQGGVHPTDIESGGWNIDDTSSSVMGIRPPEARDLEARGTERWGWIEQ